MAAYSGAPDAVDFSFDRIPGKTLAASGIKLAARYLSHTPGKNLTAAEAQDMHTHGVAVLLNWESAAGRPLLGWNAGAADGGDAADLAESIGAPHGLTIYYSCDRDVNSGQYDAIADYYRAAKRATTGRYRVGVYGEFEIVDELHRRGVVDGEWQTYAWSGGRLSAQTDLYQYLNGQRLAGAAVDYDHIVHAAELGAWWPPGTPLDTPTGDLMPTADEIADAVWHHRMQGQLSAQYGADQLLTDIRAIVAQTRDSAATAASHSVAADSQTDNLAARFATLQSGLVSDVAALVAAGGAPDAVAQAVVQRLGAVLVGSQ